MSGQPHRARHEEGDSTAFTVKVPKSSVATLKKHWFPILTILGVTYAGPGKQFLGFEEKATPPEAIVSATAPLFASENLKIDRLTETVHATWRLNVADLNGQLRRESAPPYHNNGGEPHQRLTGVQLEGSIPTK